jgi:hypothetical protein
MSLKSNARNTIARCQITTAVAFLTGLPVRSLLTSSALLIGSLMIGCSGPTTEQLQDQIRAAAAATSPTTDPKLLTQHEQNVKQAIEDALQKQGTNSEKADSLQEFCIALVAEEFRLTFPFATVADAEHAHFRGTVSGMMQAFRSAETNWGDRCLHACFPQDAEQGLWLQDEAASGDEVHNWLRGLQTTQDALTQISGRAVTPAAFQELCDLFVNLTFRCRNNSLRIQIVDALLEYWPREQSVIGRLFNQRLQTSSDDSAVQLYEQFAQQLALSVPLALLRRDMDQAAVQPNVAQFLQTITAFEQRAAELVIPAETQVQEALQGAMQSPLSQWGSDRAQADYLASLLQLTASEQRNLNAIAREALQQSITLQLQLALEAGTAAAITQLRDHASLLNIDSKTLQSAMLEQTSEDTAESSGRRLVFAATLPAGPARLELLKSVLQRTSLNATLLKATLRIPADPLEWAEVSQQLRALDVAAVGLAAADLFAISSELPVDSARSVLLQQSFRLEPPELPRFQAIAAMDLSEAETAELITSLEELQVPILETLQPTERTAWLNLLRESDSATTTQLLTTRLPAQLPLTFQELRRLLKPVPVPGLEALLAESARQALEQAAEEPTSDLFADALEFYEEYRQPLKLASSPVLVQASYEQALGNGDAEAVCERLRALLLHPQLITPENGIRLQQLAQSQLEQHTAKKQAIAAVTTELLTSLQSSFPPQAAALQATWIPALLQEPLDSQILRQQLPLAVSIGYLPEEQAVTALIQQLENRNAGPETATELVRFKAELATAARLLSDSELLQEQLQQQRLRWERAVVASVQVQQDDFDQLTALRPLVEDLQQPVLTGKLLHRLLELSPLSDAVAIRFHSERFLKLPDAADLLTTTASRRLLRYAISSKNWDLAEQQLDLLQQAGPLDEEEQRAAASLQNVLFALQLARNWRGRPIPINIVRTVNGQKQQLVIDLNLDTLQNESVSGVTSLAANSSLGKVNGRITEAGLELQFSPESVILHSSSEPLSVVLNEASLRSEADDIELSEMNRNGRLLVGELPDGDMTFVELPADTVPLKPYWEALNPDRRDSRLWNWYRHAPNSNLLDENRRFSFHTAAVGASGNGSGGKLTFAISDLTRDTDLILRGELITRVYFTQAREATRSIRFLRNSELQPFATEILPLRSNRVDTQYHGFHFGRKQVEIRIPQGTRLLIVDLRSLTGRELLAFNGMTVQLAKPANSQ